MRKTSQQPTEKPDWRDSVTWYTHETTFAWLAKHFSRFLFVRILATVDCAGMDNVPTAGPCILASNHLSSLDPIFLGLTVPRHSYYMAKMELYKNSILGWTIRQLGSFPIYRGENDAWAMNHAGRILAAGGMVCMFPEGTRSRTAELKRGHAGAAKLALEYQAPLVPAALMGTHKFHLGRKHTNQISIRVGEPFDAVAMAGPPPYDPQTLRQLTTTLMQRIAALLPPAKRGVYA